MSSKQNDINAAYVASWKEKNPKLKELEIDGKYLKYLKQKVNIQNIYMQDILINPYIYHSIPNIEAQRLFNIIKLHVLSIKMKEKNLEEKVRRLKEYEY